MPPPEIIPGSITIIPDLDYTSTGSISVSSDLNFYLAKSYDKNFSWRVDGSLEREIGFSWNTGEGEYYWYRIEGECGTVNCDTAGVDASRCNNMTFVTVVSARNVAEVCDTLKAPRLNPPVGLKISAIRRYSRPVLKDNILEDQCNTLDEQEFCQVPECLDYCIDQTAQVFSFMSMSSIDFISFFEMNGGFSVAGSSENNRNRRYDPSFPLVGISGEVNPRLAIYRESSGRLALSGTSARTFSHYSFACSGAIWIYGESKSTSPSANFSSSGAILIHGSSRNLSRLSFESDFVLVASGSADSLVSLAGPSSGSLEVSGAVSDYASPSYFYSCSGGPVLDGEAERGFESLGTVLVQSIMNMESADISSYFDDSIYANSLTISGSTASPLCGCGPMGLALGLRHNLFGSSALGNFLNRNDIALPSTILMSHRSADSTWIANRHLSGGTENWSILFSLSCMTDVWRFTFSARRSLQGLTAHTKFIVDMPSEIICADNKISTLISLGVGKFGSEFSGEAISATSPPHKQVVKIIQNSVFVDGYIFEYVTYYDNIGLFKDSYWIKRPFEIHIDPTRNPDMPLVDLKSIF
jgi:hypothetical protein